MILTRILDQFSNFTLQKNQMAGKNVDAKNFWPNPVNVSSASSNVNFGRNYHPSVVLVIYKYCISMCIPFSMNE